MHVSNAQSEIFPPQLAAYRLSTVFDGYSVAHIIEQYRDSRIDANDLENLRDVIPSSNIALRDDFTRRINQIHGNSVGDILASTIVDFTQHIPDLDSGNQAVTRHIHEDLGGYAVSLHQMPLHAALAIDYINTETTFFNDELADLLITSLSVEQIADSVVSNVTSEDVNGLGEIRSEVLRKILTDALGKSRNETAIDTVRQVVYPNSHQSQNEVVAYTRQFIDIIHKIGRVYSAIKAYPAIMNRYFSGPMESFIAEQRIIADITQHDVPYLEANDGLHPYVKKLLEHHVVLDMQETYQLHKKDQTT